MSVKRLMSPTARENRELIKIHEVHIASVIEKIAGVCGLSEKQKEALEFYLLKDK